MNITASRNVERKWILIGIPIIIILGSIIHFVYEWSGKLLIVGIFAPVNESVFEHLKLSFWIMLIWWILGYFIFRSKIASRRWFTATAVAMLVCPVFIMAFYYTYTGALGIHSLILDITSLIIGVILAQYCALHIYTYTRVGLFGLYIFLIILLLLVISFIYLTVNPPHLPFFMDSLTGQYGI